MHGVQLIQQYLPDTTLRAQGHMQLAATAAGALQEQLLYNSPSCDGKPAHSYSLLPFPQAALDIALPILALWLLLRLVNWAADQVCIPATQALGCRVGCNTFSCVVLGWVFAAVYTRVQGLSTSAVGHLQSPLICAGPGIQILACPA
jgi:hypothetical protein